MSFAHCDNSLIATCLEAMKQLVVSRGGTVHQAAVIEESEGSLRVVCHSPGASGQPLFKIPDTLLVPTEDLIWTDSDVTLELASPPDLSAHRAEMLDLFIAIYNASDKLSWHQNQAARVLLKDAELASRLSLIKPGYVIDAPSPAAALIETRNYSSKHAQADMAGRNCLMPLIDCVNHHFAGSRYFHEMGYLQTEICRPDESDECFSNYGSHRDPLGLALGHGYLDPATPYARSVPVVIEFANFGSFEVAGKHIAAKHHADLPKVEFSEQGVTVSHLPGDVRSPHHLHAILQLALSASGKRRGIGEAIIARVLAELPEAILAANREKLGEFGSYLATRPELPLASLLADACRYQQANLEKIFAGECFTSKN